MPRVHRENLFLTVSPSTAESLQQIGGGQDRIRQICNGVEAPDPPDPCAVAGADVPRVRQARRLQAPRPAAAAVGPGAARVGRQAGDRRGRAGAARLQALAGPGVEFTGRVSDAEKHRLMCAAWLFLHPALIEGWGIVVAEAAIRGTPSVAFDVPGLRDSVVHGQTGMLVRTEGQFASEWASLAIDQRRREQLGRAARTRALQLHWSAAVDGFADVADEAIKRARNPS
jgi:Glycosyltransferase